MEPIEYRGKYNTCKVFAPMVEESAVLQIINLLCCEAFAGCKIRIMPDVHAGAGCVIGFTCPLNPNPADLKVIPNIVGVDLGCGVVAVPLGAFDRRGLSKKAWFEWFDGMLRASVPSGFSIRNNVYPRDRVRALYMHYMAHPGYVGDAFGDFETSLKKVVTRIGLDISKVTRALGTLGGGNHFIELDQDSEKHTWLTVHSGSRNFGLQVAQHYQKRAIANMGKRGGLEWLDGEDAQKYLRDMRIAQQYARLNRLVMLDALTQELGLNLADLEQVESVHNFIGDDDIIRKGAISAKAGEKVVIPWNMAAGLALGTGRGNEDWNCSAPHGAGRLFGRSVAKKTLSLEVFKASMEGVWSSCICKDTLDESPQSYKDPESIQECIADTVEVTETLKPVYNFKASKGE